MTAAWLRQMGWDVYVLSVFESTLLSETGRRTALLPEISEPLLVEPSELAAWLDDERTTVFDFTTSANYVKRHIPSAWFVLRSELARALALRPQTQRYVLTCGTGLLARFAAHDLKALSNAEIFVLKGGTTAWIEAGLPLEKGESRLASEFVDRYRRPYEGTNNSFSAMQDYLDWEDGLVAQIERDGTHHFKLL
jgi:rhodanese-related sulfurtransferase